MTQQKKQELIRAFRNYVSAHERLYKMIDKANDSDSETYFTKEYPFDKCFFETLGDVSDWVKESIAFLNKKEALTFDQINKQNKLYDSLGVSNPNEWLWELYDDSKFYKPTKLLNKDAGEDVKLPMHEKLYERMVYDKRVAQLTSMEIMNLDDVKTFTRLCIIDSAVGLGEGLGLGLGFHVDNDFNEYVMHTGETIFDPYQADALNDQMTRCIKICADADVDIYGIGIDIWKQLKMIPS